MMGKKILLLLFSAIAITASAQNLVGTYAGTGMAGFKNGNRDTATFRHPFGICRDKENNLYVADGENNCIRKINTSTGMVSTLAGTGVAGWKDGDASVAQFRTPTGVCADDAGNIYVADFENHRIRKISRTGLVSTIAGSGIAGYANGDTTYAQFNYPRSICIDYLNNLYIADSWNHRIRKVTATGIVSTYAGGGSAMNPGSIGSYVDASDTSARFYTPSGISIDISGTLYVADAFNHRIRKIDANRVVSTIAGSGPTGNGSGGYANGDSSTAVYNTPTELYADDVTRQLYIGDTYNNRIRKVDIATRETLTYAGSGDADYIDEVDSLAAFNYTRGVTMDIYGTVLYVADYNNNVIRMVEQPVATGISTTRAGGQVSLYPNPTTGPVSFASLPPSATSVAIFDALGNKVAERKISADKSMDVSQLPAGMYLLKIQGVANAVPHRLIKLL